MRRVARKGGPRRVLQRQFVALLAACFAAGIASAAPPGAVISNQATLYHEPSPGLIVPVPSNIVEVTAGVVRSPATVALTRVVAAGGGDFVETVGPAACLQGGAFVNLADPVLVGGGAIDPAQPQDVSPTVAYNLGEPAFIRLVDTDQNLDYQVIDYATVTVTDASTGDAETIRLTETGPDTGVFTGYVPTAGAAAVPGDCVLQGSPQSTIAVSYTDPADPADTANDSAELDPAQRVFESSTGTMVSGVAIELVDALTGAPALTRAGRSSRGPWK